MNLTSVVNIYTKKFIINLQNLQSLKKQLWDPASLKRKQSYKRAVKHQQMLRTTQKVSLFRMNNLHILNIKVPQFSIIRFHNNLTKAVIRQFCIYNIQVMNLESFRNTTNNIFQSCDGFLFQHNHIASNTDTIQVTQSIQELSKYSEKPRNKKNVQKKQCQQIYNRPLEKDILIMNYDILFWTVNLNDVIYLFQYCTEVLHLQIEHHKQDGIQSFLPKFYRNSDQNYSCTFKWSFQFENPKNIQLQKYPLNIFNLNFLNINGNFQFLYAGFINLQKSQLCLQCLSNFVQISNRCQNSQILKQVVINKLLKQDV
ncbi:hypothetical protein pb186bvf_002847 [Paramecium bursaria]